MRIVVFGAAGRAGSRVVAEARARGHEVTAVVRNPAAGTPGDVTDRGEVTADSAAGTAGGVTDLDEVAAVVRDSAAGTAGDVTGPDQVTAVVRDSAVGTADDVTGLDEVIAVVGDSVVGTAGDVTDSDSVAAVAAGHDVAVNAAAQVGVPDFYPAATKALLDGLPRAGVPRLIAIGIGSMLESAPGAPLYAAPDFPPGAREFTLGHVAELAALQSAGDTLDWLVLAPPPTMLDATGPGTGRYRLGGTAVLPTEEGTPQFAYADLARAVLDEIETPRHHRALVAVGP